MKKEENKRPHPRKPCGWLYGVAVALARVFFRVFYGLRINNSETAHLREPVFMICNHASNYDFIFAAIALYPLKINFMVSNFFFHHWLLRRILRLMGAFPKEQFVPDTAAIKDVLYAANKGGSVGIFPEGQVCYRGTTSDFDAAGLAKLVKKLGLPLVGVKLNGNHLTFPKWAKGRHFPATIECTTKVLLNKEKISISSVEEIAATVQEAMTYNDFAWQRTAKAANRRRTAEGLEGLLYRCPVCGRNNAMTSAGKVLRCELCGYSVAVDEYGFFRKNSAHDVVFEDPAAWFLFEREAIAEEFAEDKLPVTSHCALMRTIDGKHGYFPCGEGMLRMDGEGLHFEGTKDGEPFAISVLCDHQEALAHNENQWAVDIPGEGGVHYAVAPDDHRDLIRFVEGYLVVKARRPKLRKRL